MMLYNVIVAQGEILVAGANRASASINELMYLIFYIGIIVSLIVVKNRLLKTNQFIDHRKFIFVLITSLFVAIPLYKFSAGLFAVITGLGVTNRFYYSSSLFVLLPISIYYVWYLIGDKYVSIAKINLSLIVVLFSVLIYSKYYTQNQTYYKNIKSIKNSFFERQVGFNLSKEQISIIGQITSQIELNNMPDKEIYYIARSDIAYVLKYIYNKKVYWSGRRGNIDYTNVYKKHRYHNSKIYKPVLFKIPEGFPKYEPYM